MVPLYKNLYKDVSAHVWIWEGGLGEGVGVKLVKPLIDSRDNV